MSSQLCSPGLSHRIEQGNLVSKFINSVHLSYMLYIFLSDLAYSTYPAVTILLFLPLSLPPFLHVLGLY